MSDVEEIIDFIKQLKKGFDKDLFQSKIEQLAYVAETSGLDDDDFHTLFKVWLNLSIPITKWVSLGMCLVPQYRVEERTVDYAFRWLLANCEIHSNFSRMGFLLDWLTAAMDSDTIDMAALDSGYEIFYTMLSFELLTAHALKLVYTLTKPSDVTRRRVLELLEHAKKREGKKNMYRQLQVLLGLFKSYKPECVPEDVPAISIHTSFRKINTSLLGRFKKSQERRNSTTKERHHLMWINPLNSEGGRNRKAEPLVPNMEFTNIGSKQYDREPQKTHLDFSDPISLLQHSIEAGVTRPGRVRALLCNQAGLTLLTLATDAEQAFLSHQLYHLLVDCFLGSSPHTYAEKADLLHRLGALQRTLLQGIPVVTRFLAQYLPFWNEKDYTAEILGLVEWLSMESVEHVSCVVEPLMRMYLRAAPLEQCAILKTLTTMYCNMVYSSIRSRRHFLSAQPHAAAPARAAAAIADVCHRGLQVSPEDMRVLYSCMQATEGCSRAEARYSTSLGALPHMLTLALPLVVPSAALVDKMAAILILYRKIFSAMKSANKHKEQTFILQRKTLEGYTLDFLNCLYHEQALSDRKSGLVFDKLHPQLVSKLSDLVPEADGKFSLRNNLAFAPYTYMPLEAVDPSDATNKLCFDTMVSHTFPKLSQLLTKAVPELR
ncbi:uncharacterized protein LOC126381851 [Pectinophora gossypiella]|uniref:uncharacterized protein LOC126381851 n=1 Tax=Pectinophora gossypiella TaxID=13191 RepID=UPI00214F11A8|nr:uncharacterized protein LOC126381851 [Pectinophora gossypiella]